MGGNGGRSDGGSSAMLGTMALRMGRKARIATFTQSTTPVADQLVHQITLGTRSRLYGSISLMQADGMVRVKKIAVAGDAQRQGVGSRLYDAAIRVARDAGASRFVSDTHVSRDAQRRWTALSNKYGKVTTRPHTIDPKTGQMRSNDKGPVYMMDLR